MTQEATAWLTTCARPTNDGSTRDLEPECYEIVEILDTLTPDRRDFLTALGGGLLFLVTVRAQDRDLPVRVQVADDGTYRAFTGKMDMGQGSRTLLTQAFAEELGVPVGQVHLVMGDTRLCPDDGGTWASITTPQTVPVIRKAAAAVRARRTGASRRADRASALDDARAVDPERHERRHRHRRKDLSVGPAGCPACCTPPSCAARTTRARLASFDAAAAERMPGVRVLRDGDLLAAIAADMATARRAAALVTAEWVPSHSLTARTTWPALFRKTAVEPVEQPRARYPPLLRRGDVAAGLKRGRAHTVVELLAAAHRPRADGAACGGRRVERRRA